jgi:hypothetical protein
LCRLAGRQQEPYLAPNSPFKLGNIYILTTSIPRNGLALNWNRRISLGNRVELRWSNFPLINVPPAGQVKTAGSSDESIETKLPTRYLPETEEDEIPLPGYAQVGFLETDTACR